MRLKDFWSRDFKSFTQADKDWWSTTGHNEVTVYVLTQELARIDCIITDKATMIWDIEKIQIPILGIPIAFKVTQWPSKEAYQAAGRGMVPKPPIAVKFILFRQSVADMYDTHYFRSNYGDPYVGKTWCQKLKEEGKPIKPPYPTIIQQVGMHINYAFEQVLAIAKMRAQKILEDERWTQLGSWLSQLSFMRFLRR